jgi:hypothetical protein
VVLCRSDRLTIPLLIQMTRRERAWRGPQGSRDTTCCAHVLAIRYLDKDGTIKTVRVEAFPR